MGQTLEVDTFKDKGQITDVDFWGKRKGRKSSPENEHISLDNTVRTGYSFREGGTIMDAQKITEKLNEQAKKTDQLLSEVRDIASRNREFLESGVKRLRADLRQDIKDELRPAVRDELDRSMKSFENHFDQKLEHNYGLIQKDIGSLNVDFKDLKDDVKQYRWWTIGFFTATIVTILVGFGISIMFLLKSQIGH